MGDRFAGKVVVVTGGARGIGEAIIASFIEEGASAVSFDLGEPEAPQPRTRYLNGNVSDLAAVEALFADIDAHEGRVDVLVNNAGIQRLGLTDEIDPATWRSVVEVHLFGTYNCSHEALKRMRVKRSGAIVSVSSVASLLGVPGRGPYSAAKGAISALTRTMAIEYAEAGIRVNAIAPGMTQTKLVDQGFKDGSIDGADMIAGIPMRRLARVEEIARVIRFLASDDASYLTGQTIVVDGGWTIQGMRNRPEWLDPTRD
jgi:NAD(P)-dependent dehydrogenase (short-subunit alcohol dehydrogenase family)